VRLKFVPAVKGFTLTEAVATTNNRNLLCSSRNSRSPRMLSARSTFNRSKHSSYRVDTSRDARDWVLVSFDERRRERVKSLLLGCRLKSTLLKRMESCRRWNIRSKTNRHITSSIRSRRSWMRRTVRSALLNANHRHYFQLTESLTGRTGWMLWVDG